MRPRRDFYRRRRVPEFAQDSVERGGGRRSGFQAQRECRAREM